MNWTSRCASAIGVRREQVQAAGLPASAASDEGAEGDEGEDEDEDSSSVLLPIRPQI